MAGQGGRVIARYPSVAAGFSKRVQAVHQVNNRMPTTKAIKGEMAIKVTKL